MIVVVIVAVVVIAVVVVIVVWYLNIARFVFLPSLLRVAEHAVGGDLLLLLLLGVPAAAIQGELAELRPTCTSSSSSSSIAEQEKETVRM